MRRIKRLIIFVVLCSEVTVFAYFAYTGKHGIREIRKQQHLYATLQRENEELVAEVKKLQAEVSDWKKYPFYAEQYARQQLQLARPHDEIYITA